MHPLSGTTIISLEQAVAAPFASRQLAELGARVIKLERPKVGDFARGYDRKTKGLSSHFVWLNRSKESLTLNLKTTDGKAILERLLADADVFLHNLAPGAVDRLGFADERLRRRYPRLIICHISGYGTTGPYRNKKAYDLLIQAEAGVLSITGTEETPAKVGIPVADIAAGMYAYSGILTALLARHQSGCGTVIEVSMLEALGEWMGFPAYYSMGGEAPRRNGASHAAIAPYGPFETGDRSRVLLAVQNDREWQRFCEIVLQRPFMVQDAQFSDNDQRVANRPALHAAIDAVFSQLTRDEIVARLEKAKIANAEIRDVQSFRDHPQLAARERWREVASPAGAIPMLIPPVSLVDTEPVLNPIPALGEHTNAILSQLGYSSAEIIELQADEVV